MRQRNKFIFILTLCFVFTLFCSHPKALSLSLDVTELLTDEAVAGKRYDLISSDETTTYLTTSPQGKLDLSGIAAGFYRLEQIRYVKLESGADARIVESREMLRIQPDGVLKLNGAPMPQKLHVVDDTDQRGSGLVMRLWDKTTGMGLANRSIRLTQNARELSSEELTYQEDLASFMDNSTDEAQKQEAQDELDRLASSVTPEQDLGTFTTDAQGILYVGPLAAGEYTVTSDDFAAKQFTITEDKPVAYLYESIELGKLPKTKDLTFSAQGPEDKDWSIEGKVLQAGGLCQTITLSSSKPSLTIEAVPAYGPDRAPIPYQVEWQAVEGYRLETSDNSVTLIEAPDATTTQPTTQPTTQTTTTDQGSSSSTPTETTAQSTETSSTETAVESTTTVEPTEPTASESTTAEPTETEATTSETPTTEAPTTTPEPTTTEEPPTEPPTDPPTDPTTERLTLPTLPTLPDFTRPTISPEKPHATLPPRPDAQGGLAPRPAIPQRPGGELMDGDIDLTDETEEDFKDDQENPATYDPGITTAVVIGGLALAGIIILEILQRRRDS